MSFCTLNACVYMHTKSIDMSFNKWDLYILYRENHIWNSHLSLPQLFLKRGLQSFLCPTPSPLKKYYNHVAITVTSKSSRILFFSTVIFCFIAFHVRIITTVCSFSNMLEFAWKSIRVDKMDSVLYLVFYNLIIFMILSVFCVL